MARQQTCPETDRLGDLLSGVLPPDEQEELSQHLDTCGHCQQTLETLAGRDRPLPGAGPDLGSEEPAPEPALRRVMADLEDLTEARPAGNEDVTLDFLKPAEKPGQLGRLGHYEVLEVVGRGGMGLVLKAFDQTLHRVVAIKVMPPQLAASSSARQRFVREARAAAAVRQEHVIDIHAVGEESGLPYLVMEYVSGVSLQQRLDGGGSLVLTEILRIGMQTAAGLAAAHAQGLIHRDVKPANILLENGVERVKLTDFGLARAVDDASLTQSGVVAGTPHYMAPEQARGEHVDHRADLFSLGSVLYAMCTGRPPFRAGGTLAVLKRVCEDTPRPIREINPEIPGWLAAIIERLHAKDPAERFQTAAELADLLGRHLGHLQQPALTAMPTGVERPARGRRWRRRFGVIAAVLLLLIGGVGLTEATRITQLGPAISRIVTGEGILVVEVDDPRIQVTVEGDEGVVLSRTGAGEVRLRPGSYRLQATRDGKLIREDLVTITRGGKAVVKVRLESPDVAGEIRRFAGHTERVWAVAFSPDGHQALSAGWHDEAARLWDVDSGQELRRLEGHTEGINSVAFSPDGRLALTGSSDQTVRLWEVPSGRELRRFEGHTSAVWSVAFSRDGRRALSCGTKDLSVRLWDVATGQQLRRFDGHTVRPSSVAFSPDGRRALSGGWERVLFLWDVESGEELRRFEGHDKELESVTFSPDGRQALSGSRDGTVRLWDVETGQELRRLTGHRGWVFGVAFSPDGRRALSGGSDRTLRLWDVGTGKVLHVFEGHLDYVASVAFSPDGRRALSGGGPRDRTMRLWRLPPEK